MLIPSQSQETGLFLVTIVEPKLWKRHVSTIYFPLINICVSFGGKVKKGWRLKQIKFKFKTKYDHSYKEQYSCVTKCSSCIPDHLHKYHCFVCNANLSCSHSGMYDVELHLKSAKHKSAENSLQSRCTFLNLAFDTSSQEN